MNRRGGGREHPFHSKELINNLIALIGRTKQTRGRTEGGTPQHRAPPSRAPPIRHSARAHGQHPGTRTRKSPRPVTRTSRAGGHKGSGDGGNRTRVQRCGKRASPSAVRYDFLGPGDHADKSPTGSVTVWFPSYPRDRGERFSPLADARIRVGNSPGLTLRGVFASC